MTPSGSPLKVQVMFELTTGFVPMVRYSFVEFTNQRKLTAPLKAVALSG